VGIGAANYRDITWELLDTHDIDVFVAVLDEVDKLDDDELLRSLTRAKESGKSDAHIGAICVSNKIECRDRLNERIDSSLQDTEVVFDSSDTDNIRAILEKRTDDFLNGASEQGASL
jgi:cell division control protein 6